VAIEHRLGDVVTQSLDTIVSLIYVTGHHIVPVIRLSSSIYGPIAGLVVI
jgi:hypothetical protein